MGVFSDAVAMARGRLGAIYATAALALVPAYVVGGGLVFVALAHARAEMTGFSRGEAFAERSRALPADATAGERRDVLTEAKEAGAPRPRSASLAIAAAAGGALLVLLAGLFFAQAALLPVAVGISRPGAAWAAVAARFAALGATIAAALTVVALGFVACAAPGLFAAFAFSLAASAAVAEGLSGFAALHRSWQLIRRVWPEQLAIVIASAGAVGLLTIVAGSLLGEGAVLAHAVVDAAIAAVVLPLPAFASVALYVRARAEAEGKPVAELLQYIRRTSAPG
jgi:hypothetical protein